jgi:hypothetical protein
MSSSFLRVRALRCRDSAHAKTHVRARCFSGKAQIRKVQRSGWSGGGDRSGKRSRDNVLSLAGVARIMFETVVGALATDSSPARVCASGSGAFESAQHVLLEAETEGPSAWSIPIRSQRVSVCGVAHSLGCAYTSAQAETGNGPRPATPSATRKLRIRRIFI